MNTNGTMLADKPSANYGRTVYRNLPSSTQASYLVLLNGLRKRTMADYSRAYEPTPPLSDEALYRRENPRVIRYLADGWAILETVVHKDYEGRIHIPAHGWFDVKACRRDKNKGLTYTVVERVAESEVDKEVWTTGT